MWRLGGSVGQWDGSLESRRGDVIYLADLARKLARICGSSVSCFYREQGWYWAKMADHAVLISIVFESMGAGLKLHHSWSGGFSPLSCFCREELCRDSQGEPSVFLFLVFLDLKKTGPHFFLLHDTGLKPQCIIMPLLFKRNCFYCIFSSEYPALFVIHGEFSPGLTHF